MSTAMEFEDLLAVATAWHERRFPLATVEHVALKAGAEVGEVQDAVIAAANLGLGGGGDVMAETADVMICLLVIMGRWYPHGDLLGEVRRKLRILTDPLSGYPSALLG